MVKPLTFKNDKTSSKKRKRAHAATEDGAEPDSKALTRRDPPANEANDPDAAADDDSWVGAEATADIAGPVIFVLPTTPPSCIACDAVGNVFTIPVENAAEGDESGVTAEPHDVRQVWVASRAAGSESFNLKGHHGKYLGCDKFGVLSATREAVGPEEALGVLPVPDNPGVFSVQTARERFIAVDESDGKAKDTLRVSLRGDAEFVDFRTGIRVRLQARFKPRLKANKEEKAREKISRKELEDMVGRRLADEDVKKLKRARKEGNFHEVMLDVKVKGKHDKFA